MSSGIKRTAGEDFTVPPPKRQKVASKGNHTQVIDKCMLIFDPPTSRKSPNYQSYMKLREKRELRKIEAISYSEEPIEIKLKKLISISMYSFSSVVGLSFNTYGNRILSPANKATRYAFYQVMIENDIFRSWSTANHTQYFDIHHQKLTQYYEQQCLARNEKGTTKKVLSLAFKAYLGNPKKNLEQLTALRDRYYCHCQESPFVSVPNEIISYIFSFIPDSDHHPLFYVSHRFRQSALCLWPSYRLPQDLTDEHLLQKINYIIRVLNQKPVQEFSVPVKMGVTFSKIIALKEYAIYFKKNQTASRALYCYHLNEQEERAIPNSVFVSSTHDPKLYKIDDSKFLIFPHFMESSALKNTYEIVEMIAPNNLRMTKHKLEDIDEFTYSERSHDHLFAYQKENRGVYLCNLYDGTTQLVTWGCDLRTNMESNSLYISGNTISEGRLYLWNIQTNQEVSLPEEIRDYNLFAMTYKSLILTQKTGDERNDLSVVIFDLRSEKVIPVIEFPKFYERADVYSTEYLSDDNLWIEEWHSQILVDDSETLTLCTLPQDQTRYRVEWAYTHEPVEANNNKIRPKEHFIILETAGDYHILHWTSGKLLVKYIDCNENSNMIFDGNDLLQWTEEKLSIQQFRND